MAEPTFVSLRGRVYTAQTVRPVVLARLRKRWPGSLSEGWVERVDRYLRDPAWLRFRNGYTPSALAHDLDAVALGHRISRDP